ncbi:MAG: extracellular solute-binding protein [Firmicutes bacterium]|nr:extracellular solute-binding protein [Bacillota bacterium]
MSMKRVLFLSLALLLCVSVIFTGCGTKKGTESGDKDVKTGETGDKGKQEEIPDPFGKYNPPITVKTVRTTPNPATVKYAEGDSPENNPWTRAYEEELGIKVKYEWIVDASQWAQRTNLMIASGEIPDFFQADMNQFNQLVKADLLADMTESYEKYASPYTKQVIMESGPAQFESAKVNGRLMAVPFTAITKEGVPILLVREDWRTKLNLPEPKTMNDLFKIIEAFTKNDPDGNKKDDTIGICIDNALFSSQTSQGLALGYHAYPKKWIKDASGNLVYGSIQPEMKNVLAKMQEMYKNGLIDKEFGSKDIVKAYESLTSGKAGVFFGGFPSPLWPLQSLYTNDPTVEWSYYPIPSIDGKTAKTVAESKPNGYWVVNKNMKNPEAVLKLMNYWTQTFYANTDDAIYEKMVNAKDGNEIWQNAICQTHRGFKNLEAYYNVSAAYKGEKPVSSLTPEERGYLQKIKDFEAGDNTLWCWGQIFGVGGILKVVGYYRDNDLYVQNEFYGEPTKTQTEKGATLNSLEDETFMKIVTGVAPISEFDNFVEQWKKLGGDDWTREVNEWYKNR